MDDADRIASIANFCHAWQIREPTHSHDKPIVEVYAERKVAEGVTLYFVASNYEYHFAQSGSDWAEHFLFAGHATFNGTTLVDAQLASANKVRLTERQAEDYDHAAEFAAWRAAETKARP